MLIDGIDTLTAVTAILSVSVRSSIDRERRIGRIQVHRQRRHRGDATHVGRAARAVPERDERRRPGGDEIDGARQQRVVHDGRPAELDPANRELREARGARVLLDEPSLAHDEQRQEADAAGAERNANLRGAARLTAAARAERRALRRAARDRRCDERSSHGASASCGRNATRRSARGIVARARSPASASESMRQHCSTTASTWWRGSASTA